MTKAILVIDMPKVCHGCNYCKFDGGYRHNYYGRTCVLTGEYVQIDFDITNARHKTCPLKPMPEKKYVGEIETCSDYMKSDISRMVDGLCASIALDTDLLLATGYNACIDEILGEEDGSR